eukprot:1159619-Pelagomonas_calceolata.AAC.9
MVDVCIATNGKHDVPCNWLQRDSALPQDDGNGAADDDDGGEDPSVSDHGVLFGAQGTFLFNAVPCCGWFYYLFKLHRE